ncbi:MAG: class I SAM-dependent methyltransferase [Streptosporangiaceae bacterium]
MTHSYSREASRTALLAAAARAAHLIVDGPPVIFVDPVAAALLGDQADELISYHRLHGDHVVLAGARGQVICRSRYAENALAAAVASGTSQYVILGAGLDSFAYRSPLAARLRVFEVDHPASQEAKRRRLAAAGIAVPGSVAYVACDFGALGAGRPVPGSLAGALAAAGFDPGRPAFVSWLGVTVYLTEQAIACTLAEIGSLAASSELVADYMLPAGLRDEAGEAYYRLVAAASAEQGEPWQSLLSPEAMSGLLRGQGLTALRHVSQADLAPDGIWDRQDALAPVTLSHVVHAVVPGPGT